METLCAFLNGDGGTVLFGVTDEGKIIGQDIAGKTKETIGEAISRFGPSANIRIFYVPMPDSEKKVIALHVESSKMERPFCYRGRPYMRSKCYHGNATRQIQATVDGAGRKL